MADRPDGKRSVARRRRWACMVAGTIALGIALAGCGSGQASVRHAPATTGPAPAGPVRATDNGLPTAASQQAALQRLERLALPVFCGGRHGKLVALTFDDGPGRYTPIALRELRRAGERATCFLVGNSIARFPDTARPERALAAIGDHTVSHPNLRSLAFADAMAEVRNGRQAALTAVGPPVDIFRPPYGAHTGELDQQVAFDGMVEVLWDVDSLDSRVSPPADYREISATVGRNIRPGSIVLMHENRGQTIRALRGILPSLRRRGLRSVTVPELLAADPPSTAQLAAGRRGCGPSVPGAGSGG